MYQILLSALSQYSQGIHYPLEELRRSDGLTATLVCENPSLGIKQFTLSSSLWEKRFTLVIDMHKFELFEE